MPSEKAPITAPASIPRAVSLRFLRRKPIYANIAINHILPATNQAIPRPLFKSGCFENKLTRLNNTIGIAVKIKALCKLLITNLL